MSDTSTPLRDEILALEKSYWDAMKAKDGRRTAELSGATSVVSGRRGIMTIAKQDMGKMTEEGDWSLTSYEFDNIEFTSPAPNVAILAYTVRQSMIFNGKPADFEAADSSTWVRGPNGWECHAHSESLVDRSAA